LRFGLPYTDADAVTGIDCVARDVRVVAKRGVMMEVLRMAAVVGG
jgi:hypothetical protein